MLTTDRSNYGLLVQYHALIAKLERDATARQDPAALRKAAGHLRAWGALQQAYAYRQADYKTNTAYRVSQYLTAASDRATSLFTNWWHQLTNGTGLGLAPLSVPVVIAAGAVLTVAVISYFVSRYYSQTTLDYDSLTKRIAEIAETDPALARDVLKQAGVIQQGQSETSLGTVAAGVKWAVAAGGALVVYQFAVKRKLIKPLKF